ncbi:uncharacterized protein RHOBADRAFT_65850 [Rhodotorula graminis WP1]|uniref:Uncharacterized protein n=1 Tax=Rhodotorula graminis (strain WP1) TaxID=578459 RepID=A0A194SBT0_RHOGW|nr:uncharacterized protein RHOBADRAFT_65850 [Rhodotorula graminis WP1]KPV78044.1 hypothetical protein RHOBADRAFT_65850 [Rhodotorula graminis WP1]
MVRGMAAGVGRRQRRRGPCTRVNLLKCDRVLPSPTSRRSSSRAPRAHLLRPTPELDRPAPAALGRQRRERAADALGACGDLPERDAPARRRAQRKGRIAHPRSSTRCGLPPIRGTASPPQQGACRTPVPAAPLPVPLDQAHLWSSTIEAASPRASLLEPMT